MKRVVWSCGVLATFALLLFPARAATAQGVTSAAVAGRVTEETGAPVPSAVLTLVNGSTGQRYSRRSADDGRYNFENVAVGGPYTLRTRAAPAGSSKGSWRAVCAGEPAAASPGVTPRCA